MSRTFNLWTLAQAELLQIAARAHDFLVAHGLPGGAEQHRQVSDEAGHLAAAVPLAPGDALPAAYLGSVPEPPEPLVPPVPHDF